MQECNKLTLHEVHSANELLKEYCMIDMWRQQPKTIVRCK